MTEVVEVGVGVGVRKCAVRAGEGEQGYSGVHDSLFPGHHTTPLHRVPPPPSRSSCVSSPHSSQASQPLAKRGSFNTKEKCLQLRRSLEP